MSCSECSVSSSAESISKLQFGPTYDAYKSGNLQLRSAYSLHRSLIPDYLPECCENASPSFTTESNWKIVFITTALWLATTITLYSIFFTLRRNAVMKIRDIRLVTLFVLSLAVLMLYLNVSWVMGGTMPKGVEILIIAETLYLYFHLMRAVRILFIYKWHEAKADSLNHYLVWFTRFQFILEWRFYVAGLVVVVLVFLLPLVLAATVGSPVLVDSPGRVIYSTIRCEWWEIPTEYTVATSNSTLCPCVRAQFFKEGEVASLCEQGFVETCFGATELSTLESTLCTDCTESASSEACANAFINFYTSGSCGFPSHTPYFASCVGGPLADRRIAFAFAAIHYFIMGLNLVVLAPLVFKRDYFGMILENLLIILISCPAFALVLLFFCYPTLIEWKPFGYPAYFFLSNFFLWAETALSLGFPVALYVWRKSVKRDSGSEPLHSTNASVISFTQDPLAAQRTTDSMLIEVQQCIGSTILREVYMKFCIDEFTTENVRFLDECQQLLLQVDEGKFTGTSLASAALNIHNKYIAAGSDLEVNIPSRIRKYFTEQLAHPQLSAELESRENPMLTQPQGEGSLEDALRRAFVEVLTLMARSSWPRFVKSRYYKEYLQWKENASRAQCVEMGVRKLLFAKSVESTTEN